MPPDDAPDPFAGTQIGEDGVRRPIPQDKFNPDGTPKPEVEVTGQFTRGVKWPAGMDPPPLAGEATLRLWVVMGNGDRKSLDVKCKNLDPTTFDVISDPNNPPLTVQVEKPDVVTHCMVRREHRIDGTVTRYYDGQMVGACVDCGDRIALGRIPGGEAAKRAEEMFRDATRGVDDLSMVEVRDLERELDADRAAAEAALGRVRAVKRKLLTQEVAQFGS